MVILFMNLFLFFLEELNYTTVEGCVMFGNQSLVRQEGLGMKRLILNVIPEHLFSKNVCSLMDAL